MVKFDLLQKEGTEYCYQYYVEGIEDKKNTGMLILDIKSIKLVKKQLAETDKRGVYFGHFVQSLRDKEGNFKTHGIGAWY